MDRSADTSSRKKTGPDTGTLVLWSLFAVCVVLFLLTSGKGAKQSSGLVFVFFRMASIVGILGVPSYFIGECLPRSLYHPDQFPFRQFNWEKQSNIYEKLGVRQWKAHAIDMSKYMRRSFPKQNTMSRDPAHLMRLVQEMCNAELVHSVLTLLSPVFIWLIDGWYGHIIAIGYALSNLKDIVIQRYNRPRIQKIIQRLQKSNL